MASESKEHSKSNPSFAKRVKRKLKSTYVDYFGEEIVIKQASYTEKLASEYIPLMKKKTDIEIDTDIRFANSYPQYSLAVESAINDLQKSGKYTLHRILVLVNPYKYAPLCALAVFNTKEPCGVKVLVKGKTADCNLEYEAPKCREHRVPIMGLYPDWENTVVLTVTDENSAVKAEREFKLPITALKGNDAQIRVTKEFSKTDYLYDYTLVYGGDDGVSPYAFDKNGDLRFCFAMSPKTYGFQPISGGKFLFLSKKVTRVTCTNPTSTQLTEVDQMGRFRKIYNIEKGSHHDYAELKNGNLVMGSNAVEGTTFEDSVIELDRKTGDVLKEIYIKDYLDPKFIDSSDWAHLNTLQMNEDEHTLMVCLRNLHSVIKFDYEKKELLWILANPLFWKGTTVEDRVLKPVGDNIEWFYQSHAAYILDEDLDGNPDTKHLIIYDNHTQARRKVDFYDGKPDSYVRIYTLNEKENTVSLFKSYPLQRSSIRSNAVYEAEAGRIMAMSGKHSKGKLSKNTSQAKSSVVEFDYETGEELNKFAINHGYYRAYKFEFAVDEMSCAMDIDTSYDLGRNYPVIPCDGIDVSSAKELPEPVLEECDATENDRKERLAEEAKKNHDFYIDPEQDMARISMYITDDTLYVSVVDHLLLGIYFVGEKHTYLRDFSDTKQERPEYFIRTVSTDPIPLTDMAEDNYKIYFKHKNGLYNAKHYFSIKRK